MTYRLRLTPALLAVTLALGAAAPPASQAASDPAAACQKATAKALSSCVEKAGKATVACFKKTGAACPETDKKWSAALDGIGTQITKSCADAAGVAAAGYAPLLPAELTARFEETCAREIDDVSARAFGGPAGPLLAGASAPDRKCLLAAGTEGGKLLADSLEAVGKCAGKACDAGDLDKIAEKLAKLGQKAAGALDKKCDDLAALVGLDPAAFAAEAGARMVSAAASPCDPIDDGYCLFPFPNDYFSVGDVTSPTGRRLALSSAALPANSPAPPTPPVPVDPTKWNAVDGFSVGPKLLVQDEDLDLAQSGATPITDIPASLDPGAPIVLIDAETGAQQLLWVERDLVGPTPAEQAIVGLVGANLLNGHRYLVAMRNLEDGAGAPLPADPVFAAYRDRVATQQLPVEARRPHMEALFAALEGFGIARAELYLAWDFTTQSVESTTAHLLAMRDDAFQILGTAAPAFTVDVVNETSNPGQLFRRIDGTFQVPLYLTNDGLPGAQLRLGADGLPENEGDFFTANYRCIIPLSATTGGGPPAVPGRAAIYGHGLLGDKDETSASHVRAFAQEHDIVFCGTDWTGFAEEDRVVVLLTLGNFSNFPRFIERQHQGILNALFLARLMIHANGLGSDPAFQVGGESVIDPSGVFYDGNSQGGILGGVLAAFAQDIERFVLGVPGINYSTLLDRSVDFGQFYDFLAEAYPARLDQTALIAVAQLLWDRVDPSGHVRHTLSDTYPDTPPKKILYHVAFADHQVAPITVEIAARSNGAHIHAPVLSPGKVVPELEPYFGITPIPAYPFDGSAMVVWDSGNPAPPIENVPPAVIVDTDPEWADLLPCAQNFDSDPHECPRRQPEARVQKSEFLRNDGTIVDACAGAACLAPAF